MSFESDGYLQLLANIYNYNIILTLLIKFCSYLLKIYQMLIIWQNLSFHMTIYLESPK